MHAFMYFDFIKSAWIKKKEKVHGGPNTESHVSLSDYSETFHNQLTKEFDVN